MPCRIFTLIFGGQFIELVNGVPMLKRRVKPEIGDFSFDDRGNTLQLTEQGWVIREPAPGRNQRVFIPLEDIELDT